jgi:hypothetical protein
MGSLLHRSRRAVVVLGFVVAWVVMLTPRPAAAELGSTGAVTLGIAVGAGFQPDGSRSCETAGSSRTVSGTGACIMWAGGVEGMVLWRGRVGASLGVFSVAGQAAQTPQGQSGAAFPDRVSVPLIIDVRPLAIIFASSRGYLGRVLHGVRIGIGPSLELVRTSSDSSYAWGQRIGESTKTIFGAQVSLDGEVPLQSTPNGLSLRLSARILYAPVVVLNDGAVQSATVTTMQSPTELANMFQGYTTHVQIYLGLVYYL